MFSLERKTRCRNFWNAIAVLGTVWALVSCAPQGTPPAPAASAAPIVKTCVLPADQTNTLQGKWSSLPIKFSFHNGGEWSSAQITAVQAGAASWNSFFTQSKNLTIFDSGPAGTGYQSALNQTSPNCSGSTISDGAVLYQRTSNWTKSATAVAITTTCFNKKASGPPQLYNAIIEFNFQNFFVASSNHFPDMQSIGVHELGHLLGLDHSCGPLGAPNQSLTDVACPDPNADPNNPYLQAIMFPQVFFDPSSGQGQQKQSLQSDDQGRANCLYP